MLRARRAWNRLNKIHRSTRGSPKSKSAGRKASIRLPARPLSEPSGYLAVTVIVKNEGRYLREWLEFQRLMGVEQVYLYDNGSTDYTAEILGRYVTEGFVKVIPWATFDDDVSPQRQAYAHALCNFGPNFRWMAFIDADEFLFPVKAPDLTTALLDYEDCSSVCIPWFMFGTSGHELPSKGLVIESFTERAYFPPPPERKKLLKWKSIVDPSQVVEVNNIHMFQLASGSPASVDERKVPLSENGEIQSPSGTVLRINHYYTRSHQEFVAKLNTARFAASGPSHKAHTDPRKRQHVRDMIEQQIVHDETIFRFLPALRTRLELSGQELSPSSDLAKRA